MDILIIGNGFDLAQGLKTSYKDFLDYCLKKRQEESDLFYKTNVWLKHFINKQNKLGNTWIDLETEIYNVILKLNKLVYFRNNISYEKYEEIRFWISMYYQEFNFDEVEKYFRKPESIFIRDCYNEQIKDFPKFLYAQLREFTQYFERYLNNEVLSTIDELSSIYRLSVPNSSRIKVISFNYTDTCERYYKYQCNATKKIEIETIYVHGQTCSSDECNLVLGTHSFEKDLDKSFPKDFNIFKKHNQRLRYGTLESYQNLIRILRLPSQGKVIFHIIGHSLNSTDHFILKNILLSHQNSEIRIYYHKKDIIESLIDNITDIIGEEEATMKVEFIPLHDKERGILIPKKNEFNN